MAKLSKKEIAELLQTAMNALKILDDDRVIAGVIIDESKYSGFRNLFGDDAKPYRPATVEWDPDMNIAFVVDGILFLCGTKPQ